MGLELIPEKLREKYRIDEREHATAILAMDFPGEFRDILECLDAFWLNKSAILAPGRNRSTIPNDIDGFLQNRGWAERGFDTKIVVDGKEAINCN